MLPFPASASRGNVHSCVPAGLEGGQGVGRPSAPQGCGVLGHAAVLGSPCAPAAALLYRMFALIPWCPTCSGGREKLKPLPQPLAG